MVAFWRCSKTLQLSAERQCLRAIRRDWRIGLKNILALSKRLVYKPCNNNLHKFHSLRISYPSDAGLGQSAPCGACIPDTGIFMSARYTKQYFSKWWTLLISVTAISHERLFDVDIFILKT
jgi:hypothetical protein